MMPDPSKDLRDAAAPARVLLSQSPRLAELQMRSAELSRRQHELRRWHDGLHQSVAIWALPGCEDLPIIALTGPEGLGEPRGPGPGAAPSGAIVTADRPRVLLVDDIDDNLCALEAILRPLGLILVRASSGEEAMKALPRDDFALILLDVVMPGLDGFATAARIKRLDQG